MRDGRAGLRALAWLLAVMTASGCARGGEVNSSGASVGMTDVAMTSGATTTTPPDGTTTAADPGTSTGEDATGSVLTMEIACGDGVMDPGEECDDGNLDNTDACTNSCKLPACGDLFVQAGEACDDANDVDTDDCTSACQAAACGDGHLHAGIEACDDGNLLDGDMCSSLCTIPGCGDGVIDMMAGEQCDDTNAINTDACTATCQNAVCGDAIIFEGTEECDDGNLVDNDGCEANCTITQKFTAVGPQVNFPESSLSGWTICWSGTYDVSVPVVDIIAGCDRANLMLACRPLGSPNFTLLAHAPREAVLTDTGTGNTPTDSNGSGWYFNDSYSWGFAKQGDPIDRMSCDFPIEAVNGDQRLCWHTSGGSTQTGYRCGANDLNGNADWERVVLHAN